MTAGGGPPRAPAPPGSRPTLVEAGAGALAAGTALVLGGVAVAPLFLPGTFAVGLGLLVLAAAGIRGSIGPRGAP